MTANAPYFSQDTIAQIATPPGPGLVGAIRISGREAWSVLARVTTGLDADWSGGPVRRRLAECRLCLELKRPGEDEPRRLECPARVLIMPGPASFTGENVAEVHVPGAPVMLEAALEAITAAGARAAAAGEFTFRAFRNGRIGLGQAEAVEEVVRSGTAEERRRALARLGSDHRDRIGLWRERILDVLAEVDTALDFEVEEVEDGLAGRISALVDELIGNGVTLTGREISPGQKTPTAALLGRTNAGKSSLFNALLQTDATGGAALVSPEASTTRDCLLREVLWNGVRLAVSDNPGFDPAREGSGGRAAERGFRGLGGEEVCVWVMDASRRLAVEDRAFLQAVPGAGEYARVVAVLNKADLPERTTAAEVRELAERCGVRLDSLVRTSAATGEGIAALREVLAHMIAGRDDGAAMEWNRREGSELSAALAECRLATGELAAGGDLLLAAEHLRGAVEAFRRADGQGYGEDVLARIFSRFCIGK